MSSASAGATLVPPREAIDPEFTWDLSAIFSDWEAWDAAYRELDQRIDAYRQFEGTLGQGGQRLLSALAEQDALGQLAYKVWYYASLQHDHLIFIYFVPTALIAIRYGSVPAMCVTIASTFAAAYFFYAPRFSFKVESPLDLLELILFSLLGLLASQVVSGFTRDSDVVRRRQ